MRLTEVTQLLKKKKKKPEITQEHGPWAEMNNAHRAKRELHIRPCHMPLNLHILSN